MVAVSEVELVTFVATPLVVPKAMVAPDTNPEPDNVMLVPPATGPEVGDAADTDGAALTGTS